MDIPHWTIELHSHTIYSKDCLTRLEDLQRICRERGIDKLAITDHNTAQGALQAMRLYPMLVIPGEEIMTTEGEILAWYVQETVPPNLSPLQTIERLRTQNALVGVAHPFDRHRRGAWRKQALLDIIEHIDVVEVFNARCLHNEDNAQALAFAEEHGKLMTAGSDAHIQREYGRAVMHTEPFANTADSLKTALQTASRTERLSGFGVHFGSTYAKWVKRVFPTLRPSGADQT